METTNTNTGDAMHPAANPLGIECPACDAAPGEACRHQATICEDDTHRSRRQVAQNTADAIAAKLAPVAIEFNLPACAVADYCEAFADDLAGLAELDADQLRYAFLNDFVMHQDYEGVDNF